MTTAERITEVLNSLPASSLNEVLDFVELLAAKQKRLKWSGVVFRRTNMTREPEKATDEKLIRLMEAAMSDPLFIADLEEIDEDFRHADLDEVAA